MEIKELLVMATMIIIIICGFALILWKILLGIEPNSDRIQDIAKVAQMFNDVEKLSQIEINAQNEAEHRRMSDDDFERTNKLDKYHHMKIVN